MEQLREHRVGGSPVGVLCLEPDLVRLNIEKILRIFLQAEGLDVDVFYILLAFSELQFFKQRHVEWIIERSGQKQCANIRGKDEG